MWRFTDNSGPSRLHIPKRATEDPTDFVRSWKRRKDAEEAAACDNQQLRQTDPSSMHAENAQAGPLRPVENWLDSAEFNDKIDSPPDTPFDQELDQLGELSAPAPEDELGDSNALTTVKKIQDELAAAAQSESATAHEPAVLPASELFDHLPPIQQAEDVGFQEPDGDEEDRDTESSRARVGNLACSNDDLDDPSEPLHHTPSAFNMSPFLFAFALWEKRHNISRIAHSHLLEVLELAISPEEFQRIPRRKDTLSRQLKNVLPLSTLRQSTVKLDQGQMPSKTRPGTTTLSFDMENLAVNLLSSSTILNKMYRGFAQVVDGPVVEPWQARWWGESVRSTSGKFLMYADGNPILPSDFMYWRCASPNPACPCSSAQLGNFHMGRVRYCGIDARTEHPQNAIVRTQRVFRRSDLPHAWRPAMDTTVVTHLSTGSQELVLEVNNDISLYPVHLVQHLPGVVLDYKFNPADIHHSVTTSPFVIRYVFDATNGGPRPVRLTSPHRAELEIGKHGRDTIIADFVGDNKISLPWVLFCDAFGLYNNMYRATMGFYLTGMFFEEWLRGTREGLFPLTLGPHGTELADIIQSLFHMRQLDYGKHINVGGRNMFVCSFVAYITGDMPSQSKLSGCKSHQALLPCRSCLIPLEHRANLEYDVVKNGRYHMQHMDSLEFALSRPTKKAKDDAEKRLGVLCSGDLMTNIVKLFPALDVLRTRPIDAAHCEFAGIARVMLDILFMPDGLLIESARNELATVYQHFTFPPGWSGLQNPKTHRGSYKMNENARSSILTPVILRCWLQPYHVRADLLHLLTQFAPQFLDTSSRFPYNLNAVKASDWIIAAFWSFALSVLAIFGRNITDLYCQFARVTLNGRRAVQFLFHVLGEAKKLTAIRAGDNQRKADERKLRTATRRSTQPSHSAAPAASATANAQSAMSTLVSQSMPPPPPSVVSVTSTARQRKTPEQKSNEYLNMKGLPNIHQVLHYPLDEAEYGCRLTLTFTGETKHKDYIRDVLATNHRDPAPTLIRRENERQTISFAFAGCFKDRFPEIHWAFSTLRQTCPKLAASYDPYYDEDIGTNDDCSTLEITPDALHRQPLALYGLSATWVKNRRDPLLRVLNPRHEDGKSEFMQLLRAAFAKDYGRPMVMSWGRGQFQWAEKLSFAIRYVYNLVLSSLAS